MTLRQNGGDEQVGSRSKGISQRVEMAGPTSILVKADDTRGGSIHQVECILCDEILYGLNAMEHCWELLICWRSHCFPYELDVVEPPYTLGYSWE